MSAMEQRIAAYLAYRMPAAREFQIDELARIQGGSSQETFKFRGQWLEGDNAVERRLILRRAPPAGLVVAERDLEYRVYHALAGRGVPVPAVHFLELETSWLDRPFFIMDMAPGKPGHFYSAGDPYDGLGQTVARHFWRHLGTLASIDHREIGLEGIRNGRETGPFWMRELDWWEPILDKGEAMVEPIVRGAIRWLRRNPPVDAAKAAIVHGDYRAGNFLFTPQGKISAILDWEMCHIGDALEDVAWAIDPFWPMTRHLALDAGLAEWEATSGRKIDRKSLDWWRLFSAVKACAIWTTAEAGFVETSAPEMVLGMSGIRAGHFHRKVILELIAERGGAA
jgi:aminoglycoside phosphotransferase (APT) family kinase protein